MPDTRPRVVFTDGICNACHYHATKPGIDWAARRAEFIVLVKRHKKHPVYDCIVPFSGCKDSAVIAYRLKYELGLHPLLVTFGQMIWTDVGRHNFNKVCDAGLDIQYWRMNQEVSKKLCRKFLVERGHPKTHYDAAVNAVPVLASNQMGIPLIVFAEHGETEYGGRVLSEDSRKFRNLTEVLENCVGDDARNWEGDGITEKDLYPYIYPETNSTAVYWSYFMGPWDIYENAVFARKRIGFNVAHPERYVSDAPWPWGRSDGSFEGFDSIDDSIDDLDYYMMFKKFGFGRATRMASRLIQYGHLTREKGLEYVERYDGEFPTKYLPQILQYIDMSMQELKSLIEKHDEKLSVPQSPIR